MFAQCLSFLAWTLPLHKPNTNCLKLEPFQISQSHHKRREEQHIALPRLVSQCAGALLLWWEGVSTESIMRPARMTYATL
jgi:hypothetical protein